MVEEPYSPSAARYSHVGILPHQTKFPLTTAGVSTDPHMGLFLIIPSIPPARLCSSVSRDFSLPCAVSSTGCRENLLSCFLDTAHMRTGLSVPRLPLLSHGRKTQVHNLAAIPIRSRTLWALLLEVYTAIMGISCSRIILTRGRA